MGSISISLSSPLPAAFPIQAIVSIAWKPAGLLEMREEHITLTVPINAGSATIAQIAQTAITAAQTALTAQGAGGHTVNQGAI